MGFEAVLLDAGGVLVLPDPEVLGPLLAYYGGSPEIAVHRRAHYAAMAAKSRAGAAEFEWADYDHAYVRAVGVDSSVAEEAAAVLGRTRTAHLWRWPIPESLDGIRALASRGIPLGVVSNASGQIEATLARSGVCQVGSGIHVTVRVIVDSHVVGVAKPDPGIFEPALAHFEGIPRDRIAYVGDSVTMDVHSARAAGLVPVLLDPHDDHPELDVLRISALIEVLTVLA